MTDVPPTARPTPPAGPRILLPCHADLISAPGTWAALHRLGPRVTVVLDMPGDRAEPSGTAIRRIAEAGAHLLGRVDLDFATRPVADVFAAVRGWATYPVTGIFFDRTPTSPFSVGPVAAALRAAQRCGIAGAILNPGRPPDPLYRQLGVRICAFEGSWTDYRRWSGTDSRPGDGHLVYGVPAADLDAAWRLIGRRGAGFGLATDRGAPAPYDDLPAWCAEPAVAR